MRRTRRERSASLAESDLSRMKGLLRSVERSLMRAEEFSKHKGFRNCERTLLHMISHAQTLKESLKSKEPGFA